MSDNGEVAAAVFEDLGALEKEFARVEVEALRHKEFALQKLYSQRKNLLKNLTDFWPAAFMGLEELQEFIAPSDQSLIAAIKSMTVERYQIESETEGEPRSLRFTFEFEENEFIDDTTLVKDFEYQTRRDGIGQLVSKPVPIQWKSKKTDITYGLLDAAVALHAAEESLKLRKGDRVVEVVDREGLWQHETLRDRMVELDEHPGAEQSFFNWFGFRGAVNGNTHSQAYGHGSDDDEGAEDEMDMMLEVEIFPGGEEVANILADELWPNAMDYFMSAHDEDAADGTASEVDGDDIDSADTSDVPDLVPADTNDFPAFDAADDSDGADPDAADEDQARKRQRTD